MSFHRGTGVVLLISACAPASMAPQPQSVVGTYVTCAEMLMSQGWIEIDAEGGYRYEVETDVADFASEGLYAVRGDTLVLLHDGPPGVVLTEYRRFRITSRAGRLALMTPRPDLGQRMFAEFVKGNKSETVRCENDA